MLGTLEALKDKVSGYVEKAQDKIVEKLVAHLHPQVHSVIDTRVDAFRDNTLEALPRQCEDGLKARTSSSSVAWLVDKVLGDNTDELVEKLLQQFKPGVTSATDGLSATAADTIMAKLKDWLDGHRSDSDTAATAVAEKVTAKAATGGYEGGDADAAAVAAVAEVGENPQQLLAAQAGEEGPAEPEQQSRSLDLGEGGSSSSRSISSSAMSAAAALAGGLFGLDGQLPKFEEAALQMVHPLFEKLKTEVWELVPGALQDVLSGLVGDKDEAGGVDERAVEGDEGGSGFTSWMNKVSSKLQGTAGRLVDKVAAATLDAIDGPMQELISKLVDDLEGNATSAAFKEIRQLLVQYNLISAEAAAA